MRRSPPTAGAVVSCGDQDDPEVRLWDVRSGEPLLQTPAGRGGYLGIAALPDSRHCMTAGKDGVIRLWQWLR